MKPDQILKTTSRTPRYVPPPPAPEVPATVDRSWLLLALTGALAVGWLGLVRTSDVGAFAFATGACLLIGATRLFAPGRARGPTLLLGLGAAALVTVLAISADLFGLIKAPPTFVIAVTLIAMAAAALAALGVPAERAPLTPATTATDNAPVGRYRLVRKLGVGGMGEVWRAEHDTLARPAALKLIKRQRLEDPTLEKEILERFRMEAEVTARLMSPHTVVLYDFGVTEAGVLYYAMELLDGMSVHQLVERYGPLDEARATFLLRQACHSLIEAHDAGLVHRDLKPENLFVAHLGRDEDFLKVLDFGLVKELDTAPLDPRDKRPRQQLTIAGARPGTPGFMAPEQISGAAPIDQRVDVYALGCVAYYMLTGTAVFQGKVAAQVLFAHVDTEPDPPSLRVGHPLHSGLEQIVLRCLAKDPAARPTMESLDELLATLAFDPPWSQARARHWWATAQPLARKHDNH